MINKVISFLNSNYLPLIIGIVVFSFVLSLMEISQPSQYMFDEDMHAFTAGLMARGEPRAYEWWHPPLVNEQNQYTYRAPAVEWLHPPLAKLAQATSIKIFGDTPFGWRLPSALAGALLAVFVSFFALELTRNRFIALLAGLLTTIEPLLMAQSRIASPDIFLAVFILLTVWLYWLWMVQRRPALLILTGVAFGVALATKWSALFILPGLAAFTWFYQTDNNTRIKLSHKLRQLFLSTFAILSMGLGVYIFSFTQAIIQGKTAFDLIELHYQALNYQAQAEFEHPYASQPLQWLIGQVPVVYYYQQNGDQITKIVAQPSAVLIILGVAGVAYSLVNINKPKLKRARKNKYLLPTRNAQLLLACVIIFYWLPWFFISRPLFIYQLTPIMALLILSIIVNTHSFRMRSKKSNSLF
ncbi:MAG TPA: phospholipid carrier-dependent glycosyltransferase [Candidatus Woesebacteria bacterium]|nr:phospholipid carrier-dependent glycosyltransferase [Candidatus Woesebacteria bacterium]